MLTVCSLTAMHCECRRMADIPPLKVFLMEPFRCRERWLLPSRPPRPRHRGGSEILGLNMAFTAPLKKRRRAERHHGPEEMTRLPVSGKSDHVFGAGEGVITCKRTHMVEFWRRQVAFSDDGLF